MTTVIQNGRQYIQVRIAIASLPLPQQQVITANIAIAPQIPIFPVHTITIPWQLVINPIVIPLSLSITNAIHSLLDGKIASFFDQDRIGKTLLNFGQDYQAEVINWKYDTSDSTQATIFVKLYEPLPSDVQTLTPLWITRELSPTLIDQLFVTFIPSVTNQLYLRPPNRNINVTSLQGTEVSNATLQTLLTTGSFDPINSNDPIVNEWFVTALEGAELNIDYTDFSQFVFYSSAVQRIEAFKQKLILLENYNTVITQQSASIATSTGSLAGFTASLVYQSIQNIVSQRNDVLGSFDGYERFLYYGSGSSYSSSFSDDGGAVDQLYYFQEANWPKINGSVISVASASNGNLYTISDNEFSPSDGVSSPASWLSVIENIAAVYDKENVNRLVNNLPEYLMNDITSEDFIIFMDMVGHHFDILKSYADAMPDIYDRDSNPITGLSMDLVWNIAQSFGIDLPNQYAVKNLLDYTIGAIGITDPKIYRQAAAETWKRFLHSQIYLLKTKGTVNSLRALLNSYGILPTTIQIRESATPSFYVTQSFENYEEQTNVLEFSSSFLSIPFSSSIQTVQTRFASTTATSSTIFNVGSAWSVTLNPTSKDFGYVGLVSGSSLIASSSISEIFSGDYYTIILQNSASITSLQVATTDTQGNIIDNSFTSASLNWSGGTLYLGSSGSIVGQPFIGSIDEFRLWSELSSEQAINFYIQYPGLYNGNTTTSARDNLLVRLSFNKPQNLGASPFAIPNESPYIRNVNSPSLVQFTAVGFPNVPVYPYNMSVIVRNVLRYAPNAGGGQFVSNKITIADPPNLRIFADDSGSGIPILSHDKSMVTVDQKMDMVQSNNTIGFYFSLTDVINDSMIRSIGNIDIQNYIGDPSNIYSDTYPDLINLNKLYWDFYSYTYNYNTFVEFVDNLLQPLFSQAKKLVPSRAKLLTGIVLESPILERNKIKFTPLDFSGFNTGNPNLNPTLDAEISTQETTVVSGDYDQLDAILDQSITREVEGSIEDHYATLEVSGTQVISGDIENFDSEIDINDIRQITGDVDETDGILDITQTAIIDAVITSIDDQGALLNYINFLLRRFGISSIIELPASDAPAFNQLLTTFTPASRVSVQTGMNSLLPDNLFTETISPYINFDDIGVTTYFVQKDGLVPVFIQKQVRYNNRALTSAGFWSAGTTYVANQYVTQSAQTGSALAGDGFEYTCIAGAGMPFVSYIPPSLDTTNWRRTKYQFVAGVDYRVATLLSGSIQLVNSGSGYTPFIGYMPDHYRFRRDTHIGTLRHIWLGCVTSDDPSTTFDGGPAVEIIPSAGNVLVVGAGGAPIQQPSDVAGPLLSVE